MQKSHIAILLISFFTFSGIIYNFLQNSQDFQVNNTKLDENLDEIQKWINWKEEYNYHFDSLEYPLRFQNFQNNLKFIENHNLNKSHNFFLGLNQFSHLSNEEYAATLFSKQKNFFEEETLIFQSESTTSYQVPTLNFSNIPQSFDWRTQDVVTSVKNQGNTCGSCWCFTTAGALEGLNVINGGILTNFSTQQLLDCDVNSQTGQNGCAGGSYVYAFQYTMQYGIMPWNDYPYTGVQGNCQYNQTQIAFKNTNYQIVNQNDPNALLQAVNINPVSTALEGSSPYFQHYKTGILSNLNCGTTLDHEILIVGYNAENNPPYWIIKNSYGPTWGENGFINIEIDFGVGVCGMNIYPAYPTLT